jgi:hypothetical protein
LEHDYKLVNSRINAFRLLVLVAVGMTATVSGTAAKLASTTLEVKLAKIGVCAGTSSGEERPNASEEESLEAARPSLAFLPADLSCGNQLKLVLDDEESAILGLDHAEVSCIHGNWISNDIGDGEVEGEELGSGLGLGRLGRCELENKAERKSRRGLAVLLAG